MDKKEQAQLQDALKTIDKLERIVQNLVIRISALEQQNAKLKSATIRNASNITAVEKQLRR